MLRGDFHTHTRFSRDSFMRPDTLVARCQAVGLSCIAITDHNTLKGALEVKKLAPFRVIVGEEVKSSEGDIIGLFLKEEIPKGLTPLETVKRIKEQGGLVSIPHPFDRFRNGPLKAAALREVLPYVDIMEAFNARTTLMRDIQRCLQLALENKLVAAAVSDAHTPGELGHAYVEMPDFDGGPSEFKRALAEAKLVGRRTTPLIHVLTTYTKIAKRLLRLLNA